VRFVTPAWRPDGRALIVAAARADEPFDLYELGNLEAQTVARRLTMFPGGATWPDVSPDGGTIVFVGYTPDGFELFSMPYPPPADGKTATSIMNEAINAPDAAPPARVVAAPNLEDRPYNPVPTLLPRSWEPVIEIDDDQLRVGGTVGGRDVLAYHAYTASATWRVDAPATAVVPARIDWNVAYVYDRWQPVPFAAASAETSFATVAFTDRPDLEIVPVRSREIEAGLIVPVRRARISHRAVASLVRTVDQYAFSDGPFAASRTAARAGWSISSARVYGFSISPEHGLSVGATVERVPDAFGSDGSATTSTLDVRGYLPGWGQHHVVAVRAGTGVSTGDPLMGRLFRLGGSSPNTALVDFDAGAMSLLRGFEENTFAGRRIALANIDYRFPLAHPQRGFRTWPIFLHTVHAAVVADAGHAWSGSFKFSDVKTSVGAELSADIVAGYSLRLTLTAGAAWGRDGSNRSGDRLTSYVRLGRAF
jgi:hypothetical protein